MKQKASGFGIEMRTFTRKSGTKYLTFKTPRGSYHTFSEVIARDAAADCGSDHGTTRQRWAKLFKAGSIQGAAVVTGVAICTPGGAALAGCAESGRRGAGVETKAIEPTNFSYHWRYE